MKKGNYIILVKLNPKSNDNLDTINLLNNRSVGEIGIITAVHNGHYHIKWKDSAPLRDFVEWCYEDEIRLLTKGERLLYELNGAKYLKEHSN